MKTIKNFQELKKKKPTTFTTNKNSLLKMLDISNLKQNKENI